MVSILLLILDRYELTSKYVSKALANAHYPYELLVYDNGSTDQRVIDFIESLKPKHFIRNKTNTGIYTGLNTLLGLAEGDYFVKLDNDISLPPTWLKTFVETYEKVPNAGAASIHCVERLPEIVEVNSVRIRPAERVFGITFFSREVLNKVGYYNESFNPYGLGDSEFLNRVHDSGFVNFYLGDIYAIHKGHDVGQKTKYRETKDISLENNRNKFNFFKEYYNKTKHYYLPQNNFELNKKILENNGLLV